MTRTIKYIVLHCTATPQNTKVQSILNYWANVLKWKSPGYHYLIEADGKEHHIHPLHLVANGVRGYNTVSIHLSYIGGVDSNGKAIDNRTEAQKATMIKILKYLTSLFPDAEIKGHRDFANVKKDCPSFNTKQWLASFSLHS
jgi:N-acetylmuramoyl-L-alanine amidase